MAFTAPTAFAPIVEEVPKYLSGYSIEEEDRIKRGKALIDKRDLSKEPVSLQEFRDIIAPWYRINRTEEFILHPEKVKTVRKVREAKAPKEPKEPKVKKLTKKQTQEKLAELVMKLAMQVAFTEEEQVFFDEQTKGKNEIIPTY
jgi:hypothetical protein